MDAANELFRKYLVMSFRSHPLSSHQIKWVFLNLLQDFIEGKIDEDDLSNATATLYQTPASVVQFDMLHFDRDLDTLMPYVVDMGCDLCTDGKQKKEIIADLKAYYQKNKKILKALPESCCFPKTPLQTHH